MNEITLKDETLNILMKKKFKMPHYPNSDFFLLFSLHDEFRLTIYDLFTKWNASEKEKEREVERKR